MTCEIIFGISLVVSRYVLFRSPCTVRCLVSCFMCIVTPLAAGRRRTAPVPLPAPGTESGLDPPDPEALTPRGFQALAFFRLWTIPRWPPVR